MKAFLPVILISILTIVGCNSQTGETMVLLDEKVVEVKISESNGLGGMNEDILLSFTDEQSIATFEKAITTAIQQAGTVDMTKPDYDVMVEYDASDGGFPTHGIHLWLGDEGEKSTFMYIADDVVYLTSSKVTNQLRELILN